MDLVTMRAAVRSRGGFNANDTVLTDSVLTSLINSALEEFASEADWPWLEDEWSFTTTIDDAIYALPELGTPATTAYEIRFVTVAGDEWPKLSAADIYAQGDSVLGWSIHDGSLILSPIPKQELAVLATVYRFEEDLSADADEPLAPEATHTAIVDLATAFAHDAVKDDPRGQGKLKSYERRLPKLKRRYLAQISGPRRIRVRPGSPL